MLFDNRQSWRSFRLNTGSRSQMMLPSWEFDAFICANIHEYRGAQKSLSMNGFLAASFDIFSNLMHFREFQELPNEAECIRELIYCRQIICSEVMREFLLHCTLWSIRRTHRMEFHSKTQQNNFECNQNFNIFSLSLSSVHRFGCNTDIG